MAGNDKQLYKRFNAEEGVTPHDLQALSPPQTSLGTSPAQSYFRFKNLRISIDVLKSPYSILLWLFQVSMCFCQIHKSHIDNY